MTNITFKSGNLTLEGVLNKPEGTQKPPGVVLCHPHPQYGGSMDNNVIYALEDVLKRGFAVLRFNFRGVGRSEGKFAGGVGEREDVKSAIDFLLSAGIDGKRIAVVGYSFGSWVGLHAGASDERVKVLAGVSPPVSMFDFTFLEKCTKPKLLVAGTADAFVPKAGFLKFYERIAEPKRHHLVTGANHFWFGCESEVATVVVEFLKEVL
jgi:hypothetical protein